MYEKNLTISEAVNALSDRTGETWTDRSVLEQAMVGRVEVLASNPEWVRPGQGELNLALPDGNVSSLISDGYCGVTPYLIENILKHGRASLSILPKVVGDAPFVTIDHLRILNSEFERFAKTLSVGTGGTAKDFIQPTEEPKMRCGSNPRSACEAWCAYMAIHVEGATRRERAEEIIKIAVSRRYLMQKGGDFSMDMVVSAIPQATTGTRADNRRGGKSKK